MPPKGGVSTSGIAVELARKAIPLVETQSSSWSVSLYMIFFFLSSGDGNFTVFAKGTPEIYINNKKVQNGRELKQLKSTDIKSVDVITSPGAKYNAEVGAVIRIKTKKRQDDGISMEAYSQVKYNEKWTTVCEL